MKARAAAMTELAKLASDSAVSTSKRTSNAGMPMAAIEPAISCVEKRSLHDRFERTSWTDLIFFVEHDCCDCFWRRVLRAAGLAVNNQCLAADGQRGATR